MDIKELYKSSYPLYLSFTERIAEQIISLLENHKIEIAFPVEYRIKTIDSIINKLKTREINIKSINEISDISGLRIILLYKNDLIKLKNLINKNFKVLKIDDKTSFLNDREFGYNSIHYDVTLRDEWLKLPSLKGFANLNLEIQIRTAGQHLWSIFSHKLQYKQEKDVPQELRRDINRLSAVLEIVDKEINNIESSKNDYIITLNKKLSSSDLNIENLKLIMSNSLPKDNFVNNENYSDLLDDLYLFGISTTNKLKMLINKKLDCAIKEDRSEVESEIEYIEGNRIPMNERLSKGVIYTHVDLMRCMLRNEFGYENYWKKINEKKPVVTLCN